MNKDRFSLTEEDIKEGIENFFIQLIYTKGIWRKK